MPGAAGGFAQAGHSGGESAAASAGIDLIRIRKNSSTEGPGSVSIFFEQPASTLFPFHPIFFLPQKANLFPDTMTRYGFIGTGSMGSMLVRKFISTGTVAPAGIAASSRTGISARALADKTGITAAPSNNAVAAGADVLFICVKPADVQSVLQEVRGVLRPEALLVSIAGSVALASLKE
jgi:hypothetical protein